MHAFEKMIYFYVDACSGKNSMLIILPVIIIKFLVFHSILKIRKSKCSINDKIKQIHLF